MLPRKQAKLTQFCVENPNKRDIPVTEPEGKESNEEKDEPKRKFQTNWLQLHHWLGFDTDKNKMFCRLCRSINATNVLALGTDNFKTSTLKRHLTHAEHLKAVNVPQERQNFEKAVNKVLNDEEKAVMVALKTVYWLSEEGLPLSKYGSLLSILKDLGTPDVNSLNVNKHVHYSSYNTATDLVEAISAVLDKKVTQKMHDSPVVTILTDESTDVAVNHKLCINARVVDPHTLEPSTLFLTDVRLQKATGEGIFSVIKEHLDSRKVNITKVMGLGTDGASTMTGTGKGLTGHFQRKNPHLVNTHCVANRLALCTEQAAKHVLQMSEFQRNLEMLYYHFRKSPNKVNEMEAIQKVLDLPCLKYREVHQIRWLSFYEALDAVFRTLDGLLTYFSASSDPSASGLKKRIGSVLFISLTYAMMDVLQPIMRLCLTFQKKDLDLGIVAVDECVNSLTDSRDGRNPLERPTYLGQLEKDLNGNDFKGHIVSKMTCATQFTKVKTAFIDAVLQNIKRRFPDTEKLTALSALALRPISFLKDDELQEWGNKSISVLVDFYGKEQSHKHKDAVSGEEVVTKSPPVINSENTKVEWQMLKSVVRAQHYPRDNMANLWQLISRYHAEEFPNLMKLAAIALTHPVHTADCERSFSTQNLITTALRSRLTSDHCPHLMRLMIVGPKLEDFVEALTEWRSAKSRIIFAKE